MGHSVSSESDKIRVDSDICSYFFAERKGGPVAENYIEAENDYILGMKYKDIATKYGVTINTVKSWKQRYEWSREKKGVRTKEKVCTQRKRDAKKGAHIPAEKTAGEVSNPDLTDKQYLFCLYYVKYRNKTKAYQKAYKSSYESACSNASALWKNRGVQETVNRIMEEMRQDIRMDIMDLIQQQIDIARADIADFVDIEDGFIKVKNDLDGTLVKEIKDTQNGISIKLYDKQKAIDFLKDNLPDGIGQEQEDNVQTLADIILNSRPNRNLSDYE